MRTTLILAALAAASVALSDPATARQKSNDWQPPWEQCDGWDCDRPEWQNDWRNDWRNDWQDDWRGDWRPGWNNDWNNDDRDWRDKSRLVSKDVIVRQLRQNGYERIYDIRLDDDRVVYKVRAWDWRGRLTKLFFDARSGRFISKVFAD